MKRGQITDNRPRVNFRPLLFSALGLCFGILLFGYIKTGELMLADLVLPALLLLAALRPFSGKRIAALFLCFLIFCGVGSGIMGLSLSRYRSGEVEGKYTVTGTVVTFDLKVGYTKVVLKDLSFDGESVEGRLTATVVSETIRPADKITFTARVRRVDAPDTFRDGAYDVADDIRYRASIGEFETIGRAANPFLRLDGILYDRLHDNMKKEAADVCYALLLGRSSAIDYELSEAMRRGGIAHIFAVSGLHIGILFAAVQLLFRFLKKYSFLPAVAVTLLYVALCGFSVSATRALIMCAVGGVWVALGRKKDFLETLSLAAILVLLFMPAELFNVGFRLSFGACLGLALFSGSFARLFRKLPRPLANYLSASLSVQLVTFPVLLNTFGYFAVWGFLLNFVLIPVLPVIFLTHIAFSALSLMIPPAAFVLLKVPEATVMPLIYLFSVADFSFVITGFSLATGSTVWLIACVFLSEKVRLKKSVRALAAVGFCAMFTLIVVMRNVVFTGCTVITYRADDANALLVRTRGENVLIIDGDITLYECKDFLARNYSGELDAVIILTYDQTDAVNVAAVLDAKEVHLRRPFDTGLSEANVTFGETVTYGDLFFRYEGGERLMLVVEHLAVEIDFEDKGIFAADYFFGADTSGIYQLKNGIITKTG